MPHYLIKSLFLLSIVLLSAFQNANANLLEIGSVYKFANASAFRSKTKSIDQTFQELQLSLSTFGLNPYTENCGGPRAPNSWFRIESAIGQTKTYIIQPVAYPELTSVGCKRTLNETALFDGNRNTTSLSLLYNNGILFQRGTHIANHPLESVGVLFSNTKSDHIQNPNQVLPVAGPRATEAQCRMPSGCSSISQEFNPNELADKQWTPIEDACVMAAAQAYDFEPEVLYATIAKESAFNRCAGSEMGARGLGQFTRNTLPSLNDYSRTLDGANKFYQFLAGLDAYKEVASNPQQNMQELIEAFDTRFQSVFPELDELEIPRLVRDYPTENSLFYYENECGSNKVGSGLHACTGILMTAINFSLAGRKVTSPPLEAGTVTASENGKTLVLNRKIMWSALKKVLSKREVARIATLKHHVSSSGLRERYTETVYDETRRIVRPYYSEMVIANNETVNRCYAATITGLCGEEYSPLMNHFAARSENFLDQSCSTSELSARR